MQRRRAAFPSVAYCHSNLVALARFAAGRRLGNSAARVAERYARHVYSGFDLVLAPSRSMAAHLADWGIARVACQPLGVDSDGFSSGATRPGLARASRLFAGDAPARLRRPLRSREAPRRPRRRRASPRRAVRAARDRCRARRLRPPAIASRCCRSSPRRPSSRPRSRAPMPSSTPATRRPSASRCSRRWRAARRRSCAPPKDWPSWSTTPAAALSSVPAAPDFAAAIAALFDGDSDTVARRAAAARRRAEAGDWQRVLPGFVAHYLRLIGEPGAAAAPARRDDAAGAYSR